MYKKLAASAARFHWGSKVGVHLVGTARLRRLDEVDWEVYERRKAQRRFDLGSLVRAAGLLVDQASLYRVECLAAARTEFNLISDKQYKSIPAGIMKLWRSPKKGSQPNHLNEQLRRFKINAIALASALSRRAES
jgi:hypothetical protein